MKKTILSFVILILIGTGCSNRKTSSEKPTEVQTSSVVEKNDKPRIIQLQNEPDTLKGSLQAAAIGKIGNTFITINYYSPAVRSRVVWGGLVPFDQVWVTGAHKATAIEFEGSVNINGQEISAGKYGFFTIPGKEQWTIILNKNWDQHLVDEYDMKDDVLRFTVKPEMLTENQERLMYSIESVSISIRWERIKINLPIGKELELNTKTLLKR